MTKKSMVDESRLSPEEAKDMELDEQPKPTRKEGRSTTPSPESTAHKKMKGTRKIR
jgi:hypothetical protein